MIFSSSPPRVVVDAVVVASPLDPKQRNRRSTDFKDLLVLELALLVHVDVLFQDVVLLIELRESFLGDDEVEDVLRRAERLGRVLIGS